MNTLLNTYSEGIVGKLQEKLGVKNKMAVPKLIKIVINVGLGEALTNKKAVEIVSGELAAIAGQKPVTTFARRDISSFKIRRGDAVGVMVTLRKSRMYDFFDRFVKIVLPRIRDFRGIPFDRGFDGRGGFTIGLSEQVVFPEIEYSKIDKIRGLEITFATTAKSKDETRLLLEQLGIPFQKKGK